LLAEAALRLIKVVRDDDTVARLGGDEFIVLLKDIRTEDSVMPVVEAIIEQFRKTFEVDNRDLILTASVGVAIYPQDGDTPSTLLRNADSAMYSAKEQGRNTYSFFTEDMNQKAVRRLAIEEQMYGALERNEFYVLFQPQVDLNSGRVMGAKPGTLAKPGTRCGVPG